MQTVCRSSIVRGRFDWQRLSDLIVAQLLNLLPSSQHPPGHVVLCTAWQDISALLPSDAVDSPNIGRLVLLAACLGLQASSTNNA
jgi:hypothetical protein